MPILQKDENVDLAAVRRLMSGMMRLVYDSMPKIQAKRYDITMKADGSPVTEADVFVEQLLQDFLAENVPDLTFAGEESFSEYIAPSSHGYYAILDPIDGTENFCSGLKEWGISFTLWYAHRHVGSLLFLPELREHLMTGDEVHPVRSRIHGFSSSVCDEILEGVASSRESRLMGCSVYNLYNVVRGAFARFTNPAGAHAWDLLPGLMLAREHNCDIEVEGRPYGGEFLEPGRRYRVDVRHRYDLHSREGRLSRPRQ